MPVLRHNLSTGASGMGGDPAECYRLTTAVVQLSARLCGQYFVRFHTGNSQLSTIKGYQGTGCKISWPRSPLVCSWSHGPTQDTVGPTSPAPCLLSAWPWQGGSGSDWPVLSQRCTQKGHLAWLRSDPELLHRACQGQADHYPGSWAEPKASSPCLTLELCPMSGSSLGRPWAGSMPALADQADQAVCCCKGPRRLQPPPLQTAGCRSVPVQSRTLHRV